MSGDTPVAGFYKTRLAQGGVFVPVRIWHGAPMIDGEEQDRAHRWMVEVDGRTTRVEKDPANPEYRCTVYLDVYRYWPWCGRWPIEEWEYNYMLAVSRHAKAHAPDKPQAQPRKAVDKRGASVF